MQARLAERQGLITAARRMHGVETERQKREALERLQLDKFPDPLDTAGAPLSAATTAALMKKQQQETDSNMMKGGTTVSGKAIARPNSVPTAPDDTLYFPIFEDDDDLFFQR